MKTTIITSIATALILFASSMAFAAEKANPLKNVNTVGIIAVEKAIFQSQLAATF